MGRGWPYSDARDSATQHLEQPAVSIVPKAGAPPVRLTSFLPAGPLSVIANLSPNGISGTPPDRTPGPTRLKPQSDATACALPSFSARGRGSEARDDWMKGHVRMQTFKPRQQAIG